MLKKEGAVLFQWIIVLAAVAVTVIAMPFGYGRTTARMVLGILLTFSGFIKFFDLKGFVLIVKSYSVLPVKLAEVFGYLHPFIEFVLGVLLLAKTYPELTALLVLLTLIISTLGLLIALLKQRKLENCGCYGTAIAVPISWGKLAENLILIAIALYLY